MGLGEGHIVGAECENYGGLELVLGDEVFGNADATRVGVGVARTHRFVGAAAEAFGDLGMDVGFGQQGEDGVFGAFGDGVTDDGDVAAVGVGGTLCAAALGIIIIDAVGAEEVPGSVAEGTGDGGGQEGGEQG